MGAEEKRVQSDDKVRGYMKTFFESCLERKKDNERYLLISFDDSRIKTAGHGSNVDSVRAILKQRNCRVLEGPNVFEACKCPISMFDTARGVDDVGQFWSKLRSAPSVATFFGKADDGVL